MNINPFLNPAWDPLSQTARVTVTSGQNTSSTTAATTEGVSNTSTASGDKTWLNQALEANWNYYKNSMMVNQERVESNHYGGTITEGQSYALLKALHHNDKATFDKVWAWTKDNLQVRPNDNLFAWQWGMRDDGKLGVKSLHNATDADQDIAYALLKASEQWGDDAYRQDALPIIQDLWRVNVIKLHDKYYLTPGDWEGFRYNNMQTLDPSYMAPYVYREFAKYDTSNAAGWNALADNIYPTLEAGTNLTANGLPPNWIGIPFNEDKVVFSDVQGETARNFGYDAFRVFWRMSTDAAMGSPEAKAYLENHQFLQEEWNRKQQLPEGYTATGNPLGPSNSGFTLSAALAQHHILSPETSQQAYEAMLKPHFDEKTGTFFNTYNDYLQSVIWLHLQTLTLDPTTSTRTPRTITANTNTAIAPTNNVLEEPSTLPAGVQLGVSPTTLESTLRSINPNITPASELTSSQLQTAYAITNNTVLKDILGKLDYYTRLNNKSFTFRQIQDLGKISALITPETIDQLNASPLSTTPLPAVSTPQGSVTPVNIIQPGNETRASVQQLKQLLANASAYAEADGRYDSAELQAARNQTTNPLLREILGKMDYYVRTYNRPLTLEEFQRLSGNEGLLSIEDIETLPQRSQWLF